VYIVADGTASSGHVSLPCNTTMSTRLVRVPLRRPRHYLRIWWHRLMQEIRLCEGKHRRANKKEAVAKSLAKRRARLRKSAV
jgi:hypothetical protein